MTKTAASMQVPQTQKQSVAHTPGPWDRETDISLMVYGVVNGRSTLIADVVPLPCINGKGDAAAQRASDQEQANARLISAAPDLLAALETCLSELTGVPFGSERLARTAIAKATGAPCST